MEGQALWQVGKPQLSHPRGQQKHKLVPAEPVEGGKATMTSNQQQCIGKGT